MDNFNLQDIADAMKVGQDIKVNLAVQVLRVEEVQSYTNSTGRKQSYFSCLVADKSGSAWVRVYQVHRLTMFSTGACLLLRDALHKTGAQSFWCPVTTKISRWIDVEVPPSVKDDANNNRQFSDVSPIRSLNEAIVSPSPSTVTGKVTQVSPLKMFKDNTLPARFLRMVDEDIHSPVKVVLFGSDAERQYSAGDVLRVTDTYSYTKNPSNQSLSTKKSAKVEFLPKDVIKIDTSLVKKTEDEDFQEEVKQVEEFEVLSVENVYVYTCCGKATCRHKKLDKDEKCPTCGDKPSSQTLYSSATVILRKTNKSLCQIKLFYDNLTKLFPKLKQCLDKESMYKSITSQLPVTAKGRFSKSSLEVLSVKRRLE